MCERRTRPRSEPLSDGEIRLLGKSCGAGYVSCHQCYYSILNFDVLLELAAPWCNRANGRYCSSPQSAAEASSMGQSTDRKSRASVHAAPTGLKCHLARFDYFVKEDLKIQIKRNREAFNHNPGFANSKRCLCQWTCSEQKQLNFSRCTGITC